LTSTHASADRTPRAQRAIVLSPNLPGPAEERLSRILEFLGVPWTMVPAAEVGEDSVREAEECVVLGSLGSCAVAHQRSAGRALLLRTAAVYACPDAARDTAQEALRALEWLPDWSLDLPPAGDVPLRVAEDPVLGPMAGLGLTATLSPADFRLVPGTEGDFSAVTPLVLADGVPVFVRFEHAGVPVFLNGSSRMVDIDQPVAGGFYDVRHDFCPAVPLVACLRALFADVMWQPQEHGACLIIDDPLLKSTYGFVDFERLLVLMREHGFTTNVAFIPWNWRRTTRDGARVFREQSPHYSVSVHGCDHIAREFATTSDDELDGKAALAQVRMGRHQRRTSIPHDPVMVFPQGVFSSATPRALQRNGFVAAVNTEVHPVDVTAPTTRVRDVWDVAITRYDSFAIFTRRYPSHGIENFAFDLLLGKPCLIVTHHQDFKDDCEQLVRFLEQLRGLGLPLAWRSLGQVIGRACRRRPSLQRAAEDIQMYGSELIAENRSGAPVTVRVSKREDDETVVSAVERDQQRIAWGFEDGRVVIGDQIDPGGQASFKLAYRAPATARPVRRTLGFEVSVAARRLLSEFRDEYLQTFPLGRGGGGGG
jgi:hypothetical protein